MHLEAGEKMADSGILLMGLGPGDPLRLTREAWQILESVEEVYVRTEQHPVIAAFPRDIQVHSFDSLYEASDSFESVYEQIIERILALGRRPQGVVYAVPGHPFVAEATSPEIARRARQEGIPLRVVDGMSFIEPVLAALGIDPFPQMALVDALLLAAGHVPSFPPDMPALIAQIYSPAVASEVKLTLMEVYPDQHPVRLVHAAGAGEPVVENILLWQIDRSSQIGLLTTLYLPPLAPATSFEAFQEIIAHLRAPDGCPWDREQTHQSLRMNLIEESYEVLAALDAGEPQALCEELGDLLLQIVLHAQIASEDGEFQMSDILNDIHTKIVRRHPHVFGDLQVDGVDHVLANWERIKIQERQENGKADRSVLDGVALALPALLQAEQYQQRAIRTGFQWPDLQSRLDKVAEELEELRQAITPEEQVMELGDLLFTIVNLAIHFNIDAESALRAANTRFRRRFGYVEKAARSSGRDICDLTLGEMLAYWDEGKTHFAA